MVWGLRGWLAARRRADALRRLGGPDLDAERKKNAMSGEQKMWTLVIWAIAALLAWGVWNLASYQTAAATLAASTRPTTDEVLACVTHCAASCAAAADSSSP